MLATLQWSSGEPVACAESNVDNGRNRRAEGEATSLGNLKNWGVAYKHVTVWLSSRAGFEV